MDPRNRCIEIFGWLSLITAYGYALLLIRGIFLGMTRGFGAERSQSFWILLAYLLFFALALYLFSVGRRALSIAKGHPQPRVRFGWGRMLVGAILLFSYSAQRFQLIPLRTFKGLQPSNHTAALAGNVSAIIITSGCILLIFSAVWRGFRRRGTEVSA